MEKIALFDMDQTLADYEGQLRRDLARLNPNDAPWSANGFRLHGSEVPGWLKNQMRLVKSQPNWWLNLPRIEANFKILETARRIGFQIHILTKGPRRTASAWTEKLLWCQKNISPDVDVTITQDKGLTYGRVLMDDWPEYLTRWLTWRPRGLGIMPANDGNTDFQHPNVVRYNGTNLDEVVERLQAAYER